MSELKQIYQELEQQRAKKFKAALTLFILGPLFMVIAAILFFVPIESDVVPILSLVFFLIGVILLIVGFFIKGNFCKKVRVRMEKAVIRSLFPDSIYKENEGFELSFLLSPGFFAEPDRYYGDEFMKGTYKGISFQKAGYDLQKKQVTTDSKGHTIVNYVTYAKGTMYHFAFERNFNETVKILEKQGVVSFGGLSAGLKKVETEFIQFNKKFRINCSDETTVFYLLTPQVQEQIMNLEEKYKGSFFLAFINNSLFVAINDNGATVNIPFSKPISEETMRNVVEFYGTPALIIDSLKLDGNKYKANAGVK